MNVQLLWSWELPEKITCPVVVIDADAATTNMANILSRNIREFYIVDKETVYEANIRFPDAVLIGEGKIFPKDFFDETNEAYAVEHADIDGKTVLFMSNNGTAVIGEAWAKGGRTVLAGSFANASALIGYIKSEGFGDIIICAAGEKNFSDPRAVEDWVCGELLRDLLSREYDSHIRRIEDAKEYIRAQYHHKHLEEDVALVFRFNDFDVVPVCTKVESGLFAVTDALKKSLK